MRYSILLLLALVSLAANAEPPHIVMIMVDDMGYGDPGCYNPDSKIPTRHIDSLARDGMRFTDAHAPGPLCHVSRFGLMTGRYPFRGKPAEWSKRATIAPDQLTIASLLGGRGYRTAMVGKWHLGYDFHGYDRPMRGGPIDRGFDSFFGIRASTDIPPYFYIAGDRAVEAPTRKIEARNSKGWSPIQGEFWRAGGIAPDLELKDVLPRFTREAIDVIDQHVSEKTTKPLFLYLAYPAPHTPWLPGSEFVGKSGAGMYGDFAMMVDHNVGRILEKLDHVGLSDNTLVIFTSDNGPVWFPQDVSRFGHDSSGGLRGMKADAWEAGHRMPFLIRWPGRVSAGSTCRQLVCFTDLLATFAEISGPPLTADAAADSVSILSLLSGSSEPVRESIVMQSGRGLMMIRKGDWKLIAGNGSGGFSDRGKERRKTTGNTRANEPAGQLYNLASDPSETTNLYTAKPKLVAELHGELERIRTR